MVLRCTRSRSDSQRSAVVVGSTSLEGAGKEIAEGANNQAAERSAVFPVRCGVAVATVPPLLIFTGALS